LMQLLLIYVLRIKLDNHHLLVFFYKETLVFPYKHLILVKDIENMVLSKKRVDYNLRRFEVIND
jgi:hypothetical protein